VVVVVVVAFVLVKILSGGGGGGGSKNVSLASADVVKAVSSVPQSVLDSVGISSTALRADLELGVPQTVTTAEAKKPVLSSGGKPEILFVGEESCPYCAATRWPLVVALSKFGHFTNLGAISSSSTDVFPSTPSFSFYKADYTSPYITFKHYELATSAGAQLQTPAAADDSIFASLDAPPYVTANESQSLPFIDFGNRYVQIGTVYSPGVLHQGATAANAATWDDQGGEAALPMGTIAGSLTYPSTLAGQAIDASANMMIGSICSVDGNVPAGVCSAKGAKAAEAALKLSSKPKSVVGTKAK
jgi:hypothetical protein